MVGSKCMNNSYTNPFEEECLRHYLGEDMLDKKRVCTSYDPESSSENGLCNRPLFDKYTEI